MDGFGSPGGHDSDLRTAAFLQFGRNGEILTAEEREAFCRRRGLCVRCGRRTHEVKVWGKKALTNEHVQNGTCLVCFGDRSSGQRGNIGNGGGGAGRPFPSSDSNVSSNSNGDPDGDGASNRRTKAKKNRRAGRNIDHMGDSSGSVSTSDRQLSRTSSEKSSTLENGDDPSSNDGSAKDFSSAVVDEAHIAKHTHHDAWEVVRAMREASPNDSFLLQRACHQLRNIGNNQAGSMYQIVEVMQAHPRDPKLLAAACGAIWSVTSMDEDKKTEACDAGAIDAIVRALKALPADTNLLQWAFGALSSLSFGPGNRAQMDRAGVWDILIAGIENHPNSHPVLEWASRAIFNLLNPLFDSQHHNPDDPADPELADDIASAQAGITNMLKSDTPLVLLNAIKQNINHVIAIEWAFRVLWILISSSAKNSQDKDWANNQLIQKIKQADGLQLCANILKQQPNTTILQEQAISLMSLLLDLADNDVDAYQSAADSLECIVAVLKDKPNSEIIQEGACKILSILISVNHQNKIMVKEFGAIGPIIAAINAFPSNAPLHGSALWILWGLSTPASLWASNFTTDAALALVNSMRQHPNDTFLHRAACGLLANLSLRLEDLGDVPIDLLVDSITRASTSSDKEPATTEQACRALATLCLHTVSKIDDLVAIGGIVAIVTAMTAFPGHLPIQEEALAALCVLLESSNDSVRKAVIAASGVDAVTSAMKDNISVLSVQLKGCYILTALAMCQERHHFVGRAIVMEVVVQAMTTHPDVLDLQVRSCLAIRNLAVAKRTTLPDGVLEAVVHAMKQFGGDINLQKEGCGALYSLLSVCVMNRGSTSLLPLHDAFKLLMRVIIENKGDERRPYNPTILVDALGGLECATELSPPPPDSIQAQPDDVDNLISLMYATLDQDHPRTDILVRSLAVLYSLSKDKFSEDTIIRCGGIVGVVDVMQENEGITDIEEIGCSILAELSTENMEVKICIAETDGIESIISAMMHNPENANLQTQACAALSHLSVDRESRNLITHQGGIMLIVSAMNNLPSDSSLQENACSALCNLASDAAEEVLSEWNVIKTVIKTMQQHIDVPSVQERALGILQNLSMRNRTLKLAITNAGGIEVIAGVINENMFSSVVMERAFTTLWSLAVLESNQRRISSAGGINLVINGMMANVDFNKVQKQAFGCICTLSTNPENKRAIRENGGLDAVVFAMWAHYPSQSLQVEACRALASLAVNNRNNDAAIATESVIDAIILSMRDFPNSSKLQELACLALRNFSQSHSNVRLFQSRSTEIKDLLRTAASNFPRECSERANQVLTAVF